MAANCNANELKCYVVSPLAGCCVVAYSSLGVVVCNVRNGA